MRESFSLHERAIEEVLKDRAHRASLLPARLRDLRKPLLTFKLGGETYAIDAARVREVIALPAVCRVPGAAPELRGIALLRGELLTVVDTWRLLELPRNCDPTHLVRLEFGERRFALEIVGPIGLLALEEGEEELEAREAGRSSDPILQRSIGGRLVGQLDPDVLLEALFRRCDVRRSGEPSPRGSSR